MARGEAAKLRRRQKRKNENEEVTNMFDKNSDGESDDSGEQVVEKKPSKKDKKKDDDFIPIAAPKKKEIKKTPLILLIMMVGTTILPALIYGGDMLANYAQKHHVLGSVGYRLGLGAVPRKRVFSFYEKHDPTKIEQVPTILAKHYGDYPKLIKKLERKYQDYGYFMGWEEDEAPLKLALEKLEQTREYFVHQYWNRYAPQILKTAARNIRYNLTFLAKKGQKIWKKKIWPLLEPLVGVPDAREAERQKKRDAREAQKRRPGASAGTRRKSKDFRDDVEED